MNVRAVAARTLAQVLGEGRSLALALPPALDQVNPRDRGLLQELCYGVCRWQPQLQALLDQLLERPLDRRETVVQALLLIGLYQLHHLRIPEHACRWRNGHCRPPVAKSVGSESEQCSTPLISAATS